MKFTPLSDFVLLQPTEAADKTKGGILLPDAAKERPREGTVVAVGPGRRLELGYLVEPSVKKGDVVLFGAFAGSEVRLDNKDYRVIRESEILGVKE